MSNNSHIQRAFIKELTTCSINGAAQRESGSVLAKATLTVDGSPAGEVFTAPIPVEATFYKPVEGGPVTCQIPSGPTGSEIAISGIPAEFQPTVTPGVQLMSNYVQTSNATPQAPALVSVIGGSIAIAPEDGSAFTATEQHGAPPMTLTWF